MKNGVEKEIKQKDNLESESQDNSRKETRSAGERQIS